MKNRSPHLATDLRWTGGKTELSDLLKLHGIAVQDGTFALRLIDFDHFLFRDFDQPGGPTITADADDLADLIAAVDRVSEILGKTNVIHRFEVYGPDDELAARFHFGWPNP